jgi:hypothetical protein
MRALLLMLFEAGSSISQSTCCGAVSLYCIGVFSVSQICAKVGIIPEKSLCRSENRWAGKWSNGFNIFYSWMTSRNPLGFFLFQWITIRDPMDSFYPLQKASERGAVGFEKVGEMTRKKAEDDEAKSRGDDERRKRRLQTTKVGRPSEGAPHGMKTYINV